jgi:ferrous iron transport protein A
MIIVINSIFKGGANMRSRCSKDQKKRSAGRTFRPGRSFRVKSLDYNNKSSKQLIDMGITPDTVIYIDSAAPLGEPLVVRVGDYKVALRSKDLKALEVELEGEPRNDFTGLAQVV